MPFFVNAGPHRINGGNIQEVGGVHNYRHCDDSVQVDGQGNAVSYVQGSYHNSSSSSIINNAGSGQLTVIGQGDNVRVHLDHCGFQGYDGMNQMTPHPRIHVSMPQHSNEYATSWHSPPEPHHFDPPSAGHPQPYVPHQTIYQSNFPNVNQFPRAHAPSNTTYTTSHINPVVNQNWSSWNEPSGRARSSTPVEPSASTGSFYMPGSPSPVMMPVPSLARASTPPQMPSPVPEPVPTSVRARTSMQMPVSPASQNVDSGVAPISPVVTPPTQSRNSPPENTFTSPAPHLSASYGRPETHLSRSPSSAYQNLTTPYPHRAVDQAHAHGVHHAAPQQDRESTPHPTVSSSTSEARELGRVSSTSPSDHSASVNRPSSSGASQDAVSSLSKQIVSTSVASTSTQTVLRSPTTQVDRLSAPPSEKAIRGVHELELSVESMPPPAYSLEAETSFQTENLSPEVTSVINSPSTTGVNSQENRYAPPSNEAVRQEHHSSVPDMIRPKKKKRVWKFAEVIMRRSKKNDRPLLEL